MKLLLTITGAITALIGSKSAFAEYTLNMTKVKITPERKVIH